MKKVFKILVSVLAIVFLYSAWGIILTNKDETRNLFQEVEKRLWFGKPCQKPLAYSIGNIDPKFGISPEQVTQIASQAADVWNSSSGKVLLRYDPAASFKINMIYDERQEHSNEAVEIERNLKGLEATNDALIKQYNSLNAAYKQKVDSYNKDLAEYKKDLEKYNEEVEYWNRQGGAPDDVYDELKKDKKKLDEKYKELDKKRAVINKLANQTNDVAERESETVQDYNKKVGTYKELHGGSQEFEKGVFDGREINIYQFKETGDLRLTLIHELGHYIGLKHVENSKSIMYYLLSDQDMNNPTLSQEDLAEIDKVCKVSD